MYCAVWLDGARPAIHFQIHIKLKMLLLSNGRLRKREDCKIVPEMGAETFFLKDTFSKGIHKKSL